jgi:hypothetical protein
MSAELGEAEARFRDVTPAEIEHYREFGWVKLKAFVPKAQVAALLYRERKDGGGRRQKRTTAGLFLFQSPDDARTRTSSARAGYPALWTQCQSFVGA